MCFGFNQQYQLGIKSELVLVGWGPFVESLPEDILYPTALDVTFPSNKEVVSVHVGSYTGHAVFSDNSVYAWGNNIYGAFGDGSSGSVIGDEVGDAAVKMDFDF